MNCPFCQEPDTRVTNSRPSPTGDSIRRRRECKACGARFTTVEYVEKVELLVVKRDETREPFVLQKVQAGIERACEKRPVTQQQIETLVAELERELMGLNVREISTEEIGKRALRLLKQLDPVAYLRFASVYKQFQALQDFQVEIDSLQKMD
ncbi:MAG: transcriptional regulator NrdR [Candidatus Sumerlaeia bacterium]|nr:transcriptional regulator NrdR [Candidatus Sumerlaeia bacterium]